LADLLKYPLERRTGQRGVLHMQVVAGSSPAPGIYILGGCSSPQRTAGCSSDDSPPRLDARRRGRWHREAREQRACARTLAVTAVASLYVRAYESFLEARIEGDPFDELLP
jgi:hypothetical protein